MQYVYTSNELKADSRVPVFVMLPLDTITLGDDTLNKPQAMNTAGENALERYDAGGYAQVPATNRSDSGNT
ncbi:hypothetical protein V6N12_017627 [Hibiscus sabdariffa]|uniref:Uncharacterized protein n=1 Tax=Hibiscus sabdariffa TaxID=183260 RepID=A0ABR2CG17_9ROSI